MDTTKKSITDDSNLGLFNEQYDLPEDRDGFIDNGTGRIVENSELKPIDVIRAVAKQLGQTINDPKPNCKKCYGRGFTARDSVTKAPIPCKCIQVPRTEKEKQQDESIANRMGRMSREQRRKIERQFMKKMSKDKKRMSKQLIGDVEAVIEDGIETEQVEN